TAWPYDSSSVGGKFLRADQVRARYIVRQFISDGRDGYIAVTMLPPSGPQDFQTAVARSFTFSILPRQNVQTSSLMGENGSTLWPSRNKLLKIDSPRL